MSKGPYRLVLPKAGAPTAPVKKAEAQTVKADIIPSIAKEASCKFRRQQVGRPII
jgi:hypothetical protein